MRLSVARGVYRLQAVVCSNLETLELIESQLVEWPGTLLLVSHDRAFLDNVVTSTFVFEGKGRIQEYVGGYEDWLRQRTPAKIKVRLTDVRLEPDTTGTAATARAKKLSYREQRELDALPARIDALEAAQRDLHARMAEPDFYKERGAAIAEALARAAAIEEELRVAYARWDELDSRQ